MYNCSPSFNRTFSIASHSSHGEAGKSSLAYASLLGTSSFARYTSNIFLPKGHSSHFHPVLLIDFRVRTGDVPAEHGARFHGFFLRRGNAEPLVVVVRQFTVMRGIVRVPITVLVADLTALDTDELAGAGER